MATADEMADAQSRVDAKALMITAALPGSGDWGTRGEALAAEQSAVADAPELQSLLVREKSRRRAVRCSSIRNS